MKITVGELRNIISETVVAEADEVTVDPREVTVYAVDEHTSEVTSCVGNIEKIRVGLLNAGVTREERNAILAGEMYISPELMKTLRRVGAVKVQKDPANTREPKGSLIDRLASDPDADKTMRSTSGSPRAPSKARETTKIYGGNGKRWGGAPAVARVKNLLYVAKQGTKFTNGELAKVNVNGNKLNVTKADSDHTQEWDFMPEGN